MNIGLISDTHGIYREEWKKYFQKCDAMIHLGDLDTVDCYDWFMGLGIPVYIVRGNCDRGSYAEYLPEEMNIPFAGKLFHAIHNRAYISSELEEIDYVVYGHTHILNDEVKNGIRFINPGSAGIDRGTGRTMMILNLDNGCIEKVNL